MLKSAVFFLAPHLYLLLFLYFLMELGTFTLYYPELGWWRYEAFRGIPTVLFAARFPAPRLTEEDVDEGFAFR